ncbi:MAG: UDP-3-O-acyl-N-acetylglucosamine deacetylase [Bacteroidales bacterium]|nr:UDP-3-O-acyl-N-acetylglucosamine deacetylase [Bacteroidales bacterium]
MKQHTLAKSCHFDGLGLHTGRPVHLDVQPAPPDFGITFVRSDKGRRPVLVNFFNATPSDRCTLLQENEVEILTCEHLLSALVGLGIDNASVIIDAPEVPILDGSALPYVKAFLAAGIKEQDAEREYLTIDEPFEFETESGSRYLFEPSDHLEIEVEVDYPSKVVGRQKAVFREGDDYAAEVAPCRTFCFFNELQPLLERGLIKGGALDNALVIVDEEPDELAFEKIKDAFSQPDLERISEGYLSSCPLSFENEVARHKLLDLIGDLALAAMPVKMRIRAFRPGHASNAEAITALVSSTFPEFDDDEQ